MKNRVYIASDHAGFDLKEAIVSNNKDLILDLGTKSNERVDYPSFASILIENMKNDKKYLKLSNRSK